MKRSFFLSVILAACSCDGGRDGPNGELGHSNLRSEHLAISGEQVHNSYGADVYTFDVSNPRDPHDSGEESYAFTGCEQGLALAGGFGYCLALSDLAKVNLPSASSPVWTTGLPMFGEYYYAFGVRALPDGRLAIARAGNDALSGDMLLVDVSSGSAEFESLADPDGDHYRIDSDGSIVAASVTAPTPRVAIYDFAVATTSLELSREIVPVTLGPNEGLRQIALDGQDLVISVSRIGPKGDLIWLRYDVGYTASTTMGKAEGIPLLISGSYPGGLELAEGYAFVALQDGIGVYRLDPAEGLVHVRTLPDRGYVGEIVADLDRRLLYVGGYTFQVFDLGAITTGEPDW